METIAGPRFGSGPCGLFGTAILRFQGLEVDTAATRSADSLKAKLVESTGATYINSKETPLHSLDGKYDIVFEVTGNPFGCNGSPGSDHGKWNRVLPGDLPGGPWRQQNVGKIFTDLVLGNRLALRFGECEQDLLREGREGFAQDSEEMAEFSFEHYHPERETQTASDAYKPESEEEIKTIIEISDREKINSSDFRYFLINSGFESDILSKRTQFFQSFRVDPCSIFSASSLATFSSTPKKTRKLVINSCFFFISSASLLPR